MNWKSETRPFLWIVGFFLLAYFMPLKEGGFSQAILEALALLKWYAREHVLLCLVPAFFIAGVIAVLVSQAAVVKYFGAAAKNAVIARRRSRRSNPVSFAKNAVIARRR